MSHIVEFHVEGLAGKEKGFGKKLNRDVNVFFGLNGSGKTSLLKIFHAALNSDASSLVNVPFTKAEVVMESLSYKKQFRYSLDKSALRSSHKQQVFFEQIAEEEEDTPEILFEPRVGRVVRHKRVLKWKIEPALPKEFKGGWSHRYLPTSRLLYRRSFEAIPQELVKISTTLALHKSLNGIGTNILGLSSRRCAKSKSAALRTSWRR